MGPTKFRLNLQNLDDSVSPFKLSWGDWKNIIGRVKEALIQNRATMIAGSIAYFMLFAIFPLLIAVVSTYAFFSNPGIVQRHIESFSQLIPSEAAEIITGQLDIIVKNSRGRLGFGAVLSILVALWSASLGTKSIIRAINIAYGTSESRSYLRLQMEALGLTFGLIVALVIAFGIMAGLPALMSIFGLDSLTPDLVSLIRWPLLAAHFIIMLSIINGVAPSQGTLDWRWLPIGAAAATLLILIASIVFAYYVDNFASFNQTYGSLTGVIILMIWFFIVSYAVLLGAELNAAIEKHIIETSAPK